MNYVLGKKVNIRDAYGDALSELGKDYPNLVVLDADLGSSLKTGKFRAAFPDRHYQTGVSEAHMQSMAAGMAREGLIPVTNTFAVFASLHSGEQVRQGIAYQKLNAKVVGSHGGTVGEDGPTHDSDEDIAVFKAMPNMTILSPSDAVQTYRSTEAMIKHRGPVYLRLFRSDVPVIYTPDYDFSLDFSNGNGYKLRDGKDLAILSTGYMTHEALKAHEKLKEDGIDATLIDVLTLKPLPEELIFVTARNTGCVLTAEDHNIKGGFGENASAFLSKNFPVWMDFVGFRDEFEDSCPVDERLRKYDRGAEAIYKNAKALYEKARRSG